MEVHHHPDTHHGKKKFSEYFLEFLMIFLAVTMGFIAENIRESISDSEKEHEYISAMISNLVEDSSNIQFAIQENEAKVKGLDRLMSLSYANLTDTAKCRLLYHYCSGKSLGYYSVFRSNDATMQQLRNSGGMRLIRKDHVADSIARYDIEVKVVYLAENLYEESTGKGITAAREILDYSVYYDSSRFNHGDYTVKPLTLLTAETSKLKWFFNIVDFEKGATVNYINNMRERVPFITQTIQYLKKEYGLK